MLNVHFADFAGDYSRIWSTFQPRFVFIVIKPTIIEVAASPNIVCFICSRHTRRITVASEAKAIRPFPTYFIEKANGCHIVTYYESKQLKLQAVLSTLSKIQALFKP